MFLDMLQVHGLGIGQEVYPCVNCGEFHLGHPNPETEQRLSICIIEWTMQDSTKTEDTPTPPENSLYRRLTPEELADHRAAGDRIVQAVIEGIAEQNEIDGLTERDPGQSK